jgi:hypothetical protein
MDSKRLEETEIIERVPYLSKNYARSMIVSGRSRGPFWTPTLRRGNAVGTELSEQNTY